MSPTSVKARLTQLGLIGGVAVVALAVAMCSHSDNVSNTGSTAKPTVAAIPPSSAPIAAPPPAPPPPLPPPPKDYVEGLVQGVSGDTIHLRTRTGSATVRLSPATTVVEAAPAALPDVTPGSCVNVRATPESAPGTAITAQAVIITAAIDGKCPPPAGFYSTVTGVSGNTIAVTGIGPGGQPAPTNVTVADTTSYKKQTVTNTQAITNGRCMGAQGTDTGGVLQAMTISLEACPPMGGPPQHHLHIPHLPFHL